MFRYQCCEVGAARNLIILVEPESEPEGDAARALNFMFSFGVGGLLKMSQTTTVPFLTYPIPTVNLSNHTKIREKSISSTLRLTFVCFKKGCLAIASISVADPDHFDADPDPASEKTGSATLASIR
jgi:hypothetical protein